MDRVPRLPPGPGKHRFLPRRSFPRGASGRTLSICGWATAVGFVALGSAVRGLISVLAGSAPIWYEPTLAGSGVATIALTAAALLSIHHPRLPWVMLGLATVPLAMNLGVTMAML